MFRNENPCSGSDGLTDRLTISDSRRSRLTALDVAREPPSRENGLTRLLGLAVFVPVFLREIDDKTKRIDPGAFIVSLLESGEDVGVPSTYPKFFFQKP